MTKFVLMVNDEPFTTAGGADSVLTYQPLIMFATGAFPDGDWYIQNASTGAIVATSNKMKMK